MEAWFSKGLEVDSLRLGGGATKSSLWCQIQADIYGRPVQLLKVGESTVLGAAILGGTGAGVFKNIGEGVDSMVHVSCEIEPDMKNNAVYSEIYQIYRETYDSLAKKTFPRLAALQR
jgi:xylulokinase